MRKLLKISSVVFSALIITSCTSKPREVTASLPLVSVEQSKPNKKEIPTQFWSTLADQTSSSLVHDKYQISLSKLYVSALGTPCRELTFTEQQKAVVKRIACEITYLNQDKKLQTAWFLEPQIIQSSSYVEL